jgi:protein-tyrosine-phosphatase
VSESRLSVLFVCTGNSARSQMAEALARAFAHGRIEVASAGTAPHPEIHPMARRAIQTLCGFDIQGQHPKSLEAVVGRHFDYVITVCDRAAEVCPVFPDDTERIHWGYADPAAVVGTDDERQRAFDRTARDLMGRLRLWMALPAIRNRIEAELPKGRTL